MPEFSEKGGPSPESPKEGFRVIVSQPELIYASLLLQNRLSLEPLIPLSNTILSSGQRSEVFLNEATYLAGYNPDANYPQGRFALRTSLRLSVLRHIKGSGFFQPSNIFEIHLVLQQSGLNVGGVQRLNNEQQKRQYLYIEYGGYRFEVDFGPQRSDKNTIPDYLGLLNEPRGKIENSILKKYRVEKYSGILGGLPFESYSNLSDPDDEITLMLVPKERAEGTSHDVRIPIPSASEFVEVMNSYAYVFEELVKAVSKAESAPAPSKIVNLHPPISNQDALARAKRDEAKVAAPILETQVIPQMESFEEIAGQDQAVREARRLVMAINRPDILEKRGAKPPKGILLYGPPGTGKTMIARAIAHEAKAEFFPISAPDVGSKYINESAQLMQQVFDQAALAARGGRKVIIFFDEIDAIAPSRDSGMHQEQRKVLSVLLQNLDGFKSNPNITIIAASNKPEDIDEALRRRGRFDKHIFMPLPNSEGREKVLEVHIKKKRADAETPDELCEKELDLKRIADQTEGLSPADLAALINQIVEDKSYQEAEGKVWEPISTEDIIEFLEIFNIIQQEEKERLGFNLSATYKGHK